MLSDWCQYKTSIDGLGRHFLHVRSKHENALPLFITHGWPGSEFSRAPVGLSQSKEKRRAMIIAHIYLPVSDLKRSSEFYKKVLEPLGIDMPYEFGQPPICGFAITK